MAGLRAHLSSEHAVTDRGVEQQEWKDEEACPPPQRSIQTFSRWSTAAVSARTRRVSAASLMRDSPYDGIISLSLGSQRLAVSSSLKHFSSTPIAMNTAVDAPGDAPSNATSERSAAATSSVPNSRNPPRLGSGLMICTRCPATSRYQSVCLARG